MELGRCTQTQEGRPVEELSTEIAIKGDMSLITEEQEHMWAGPSLHVVDQCYQSQPVIVRGEYWPMETRGTADTQESADGMVCKEGKEREAERPSCGRTRSNAAVRLKSIRLG